METVLVLLLLAPAALAHARDVTDEEYGQFPRLFHLDDDSACLSQSGGLYCLGTFDIAPLREPNPTYNMLKEYSLDHHHFNRTQLHRGYCVSSRCPALSSERNASLRFERCASSWARRSSLRTSLSKLNYCRTHAQEYARANKPEPMDVPQKVFVFLLVMLVAGNIVGTIYDLVTKDDGKQSSLLTSWSVRGNWRRLTALHEDGDPRLTALAPVQGVRVMLIMLTIATHSGCIQDSLYISNPRWIEKVSRLPFLVFILNGTSVVQVFVLLSNFLLAYNLLLFSKASPISYKMLPLITIKRIFRISPVYLLVVGYAATWWAGAGTGPLWPSVAGTESEACRRKFWTHALYINNLVDPDDICLVQTWFLAVDMQLYLVASVLTVYLLPRRQRALRILAGLVFLSCLLNGVLSYVFDWKPIMYIAYPSTLRTMYRGIASFSRFYQSPWGSLPPCLIGLFVAFLHFEMQETGVKLSSYKWLHVPYYLGPLVMISWSVSGYWVREYNAPWFVALYAALERPVFSLMAAGVLLGMINGLEGWLKHVWAWRGWRAMARMSLAVLMVHWSVNVSLAASRPHLIQASLLTVAVDAVATSFFSYVIALPLTVLVEMPVQRFATALMMRAVKT